MEILKA